MMPRQCNTYSITLSDSLKVRGRDQSSYRFPRTNIPQNMMKNCLTGPIKTALKPLSLLWHLLLPRQSLKSSSKPKILLSMQEEVYFWQELRRS